MKRFGILAAAAASLLCLAPSQADACPEVITQVNSYITNQTSAGNGASFVTNALEDAWGYTQDEFYFMWESDFPTSPTYYNAIVNKDYFNHITNVANIAPGQLFAINSAAATETTGAYAGHTMVIVEAPTQLTIPLKPIIAGTLQYAVKIADATNVIHGVNAKYPDSRAGTTNKNGTGYVRIYVKNDPGTTAHGSLTGLGYTWSVTSTENMENYYEPHERAYAIGAFTACDPLGYQ
jgi:hypothetical protein